MRRHRHASTSRPSAAGLPGVRSVQPIVFDRVTLPDLDGRVAVLLGAEVSSQLLRTDNPLRVRVEWSGEGPAFQLAALFAAMQDGDFTRAGQLWDRIPGRLVMVSRPIYEEWKRRHGPGPNLVRNFGFVPPLKRWLRRHGFIKSHAERIDIGPPIEWQ